MRAVATADASSSSSAAGSRTQAACRIELRFITLGALESKEGVATPDPPIRPARFFGKRLPLTGCGVQRAVFRLGSLRIDHCGAAGACLFISMDVVVERLTSPHGVSIGLPHP